MLAETRRPHNLSGLGYSPQENSFRSYKASTSKNNFPNHFYKQHPQNSHHHAPNRYYHYKANHARISYNSVGMTKARYERINNKSDYTVIHDKHNLHPFVMLNLTLFFKYALMMISLKNFLYMC